jgi:N-acetylmuramoyl-L-alanine amidase
MSNLSPQFFLMLCSLFISSNPLYNSVVTAKSTSNNELPALRQESSQTLPNPAIPKDQKQLVMIDPGNGGQDYKYVSSSGLRESNVSLSIAMQVADIMKEKGISTKLTRNGDYMELYLSQICPLS